MLIMSLLMLIVIVISLSWSWSWWLGQFGTRLQGGKDSASPRYIFTQLSPLARHIFNEADDALLNYQLDDNQKIEPEWYIPILPMVLVNGADGIGTGWMTKIPNYNPR